MMVTKRVVYLETWCWLEEGACRAVEEEAWERTGETGTRLGTKTASGRPRWGTAAPAGARFPRRLEPSRLLPEPYGGT